MKKTPHPADIQVGNNIRTMRIARGMSQEKLGEALGITFQQVQKYEKGANRVSASRLTQVCSALNCELGQLFLGVEQSEVKPVQGLSAAARKAAILFDGISDTAQRQAVIGLMKSMTAATAIAEAEEPADA